MNNEIQEVSAPTQGQAKPLDFAKVDALRKHMLLTVESMCALLKVSRVSYYNWLKGAKVRKTKADHIRRVIKDMVFLISNNQWPNSAVFVADQATRLVMLEEVLKDLRTSDL